MPGIVEGGGGRCVCVGRSSKTAWCMYPWKESTPSRSECWHPGTWVPLIVDIFVYHLCRRRQVSDISWVSWATCLRRCSYPVNSVKHLFSVTQPHNKSHRVEAFVIWALGCRARSRYCGWHHLWGLELPLGSCPPVADQFLVYPGGQPQNLETKSRVWLGLLGFCGVGQPGAIQNWHVCQNILSIFLTALWRYN